MRRNHTHGFTLLEVMIALLVFSMGLLGMAGLLTVAVQTNHTAYLRTQATFLAQGMADRMRANVLGLWNGNYVGTYSSSTAGNASGCLNGTQCDYDKVAARDTQIWSNQLTNFLPNPTATIACTPGVPAPSAAQILMRPPYSGTCTITIAWNEKSAQTGQGANLETLTWTFQP